MKKVVHRRYGWVIILILLSLFLCIVPLSNTRAFAQEIADKLDISLFYRVRFEILGQSPKGLYYIDLFDRYTAEITQAVINHPSMLVESLSILRAWEPNLHALANGEGSDVMVTGEQVQEVSTYLDHLSEIVSPELKSVIDTERSILLLQATAGMSMNQAWSYLNQDPRFLAPTVSPETPAAPDISSTPIEWALPELPQVAIAFDPNNWELHVWNNGIATSWELKHRSLYDCVMTIPRSLSDPYSSVETNIKPLGTVSYEVRTSKLSELLAYLVYKPLNTGEYVDGAQPPEISFIVYPGSIDTQACIDQSETLLANLHPSA